MERVAEIWERVQRVKSIKELEKLRTAEEQAAAQGGLASDAD